MSRTALQWVIDLIDQTEAMTGQRPVGVTIPVPLYLRVLTEGRELAVLPADTSDRRTKVCGVDIYPGGWSVSPYKLS